MFADETKKKKGKIKSTVKFTQVFTNRKGLSETSGKEKKQNKQKHSGVKREAHDYSAHYSTIFIHFKHNNMYIQRYLTL